jgi:predicted transcriptional regulator
MNIKKFAKIFLDTSTKKKKFAKKIGITYASVNNYISGRRIPKKEIVKIMVKETSGKLVANSFYDLQN